MMKRIRGIKCKNKSIDTRQANELESQESGSQLQYGRLMAENASLKGPTIDTIQGYTSPYNDRIANMYTTTREPPSRSMFILPCRKTTPPLAMYHHLLYLEASALN